MVVKCVFADLKVEYHTLYDRVIGSVRQYCEDFESPDLIIDIKQENIDFERKVDFEASPTRKDRVVERTTAFRMFAERFPQFDGVVFHSCFINVGDKGIAFSAPSGTGKTTHMTLWQELLGDNITIINGDKPLLRFVDGKVYGYGSPWVGKEGYGCKQKTQLTDVCLIERSDVNKTEPLSKEEGIMLLMQQIYMPFDSQMRMKTINLIYRIADNVNFWKIYCNMELGAAEVSYKAIFDCHGNNK